VKWVLLLGICAIGCADPSAPPTVSGSGDDLPIVGIRGTGGSGGSGGAGGIGGGTGGSEPQGACDNASDLDAIEDAEESIRNIARDCGLPNSPSSICASLIIINGTQYGGCISECIEDRVPDLSSECAACYGAVEQCGLNSFCRTQCQLNTCSTFCLDCLENAGCIEEYEVCRGLPGDGCPVPG